MSFTNNNAIPFKSEQIGRFLESQSAPKITFGLEMEMGFAIPRDLYFAWLATNPEIPAFTPTTLDDLPTRKLDHQITSSQKHDFEVATGARTAIPTYEDDEEARRLSHSTHSQKSANLRQNLLFYFLEYLNRRLPTSPAGQNPMMIGKVLWGGAPKTAAANHWTLVHDDSLGPSRRHYGLMYDETYDAVRKSFRCVGAELVSCVYYLYGLDGEIFKSLYELQLELSRQRGPHEAWFRTEEHLHVHVAIENEDITLELAQNLCALYGLFEDQIESWLAPCQRNTEWTVGLRKGMKVRKMALAHIESTGDVDLALLPAKAYNPAEYCEGVYGATSLSELRTFLSGYSRCEEIDRETVRDPVTGQAQPRLPGKGIRGYIAKNISSERANKPTTFEFRHHHGTANAKEIKYWVKFCGALLRFAHTLTQAGVTLEDPRDQAFEANGRTFLENFVEKELLDVIGVPLKVKAHFARQAQRFADPIYQRRKAVEKILIRHRSIRFKNTGYSGLHMDRDIEGSADYRLDIVNDASIDLGIPLERTVGDLGEDEEVIGGLDNVLRYLIEKLRLVQPEQGPNYRRKFQRIADNDDSGRMEVYLRYRDHILAEDRRRAANRG